MQEKKDRVNSSQNVRNKIVGIVFPVMIFLMFFLILLGRSLRGKESEENNKNKWVASDYYPFENNEITVDELDEKNTEKNFLTNISEKILKMEQKTESYVSESFYFRLPFVIVRKWSDKAAGIDMTTSLCTAENSIYDCEDVVLPYQDDYLGFVVDNMDISERINNLVDFGSQMEMEGRNFLFFEVPGKYGENIVYRSYLNEKEDEIKQAFEVNELNIFRVSDVIKEEQIDEKSLFFKTDHHWLPSTGIWADKLLCEEFNERFDYQIDTSVFDLENYNISILEDFSLGSQGKKVTEVYCEKEDFPVIYPKYDTDLEVFISTINKTTRGSIADTLLDSSAFEESNIYKKYDYTFYGYGDNALITIHNNEIHDGSRVLMIKISFADSMYPYLSTVFENLDIIDLRIFNGSLQSYIKETNPDTVVVVYAVTSFFGKETEGWTCDFR